MNYDCIDSSIILGITFEEEGVEHYKQYINTLGYKLRNKGLLTLPLVGEIFTNLFLKVSQKVPDPVNRKVMIQNAVDFFDGTLLWLLERERLFISAMEPDDFQFISRIKELDYTVTNDDAIHLSAAINKKCQRFITADTVLLDDTFRGRIHREFRLVISPPS